MNRVKSLAEMCQSRHLSLEDRHSITAITNVSQMLPSGCIENAIKHYQGIIRSNPWYFPTLEDVSVDVFLHRWNIKYTSHTLRWLKKYSVVYQRVDRQILLLMPIFLSA